MEPEVEILIDVRCELLVADQESGTRSLLAQPGLSFESAIRMREKMHDRSVNRWRHFARHLEPLRRILEDAGIAIE